MRGAIQEGIAGLRLKIYGLEELLWWLCGLRT